jgi:preprotein translocase subunit SecY
MALVVFVEQSQRRIPVQYAKRMVGRRDVRRHEHLHPDQGEHGRRHPGHLRVSLLYLPALIAQFQGTARRLGDWINTNLTRATTRSTSSRTSR